MARHTALIIENEDPGAPFTAPEKVPEATEAEIATTVCEKVAEAAQLTVTCEAAKSAATAVCREGRRLHTPTAMGP